MKVWRAVLGTFLILFGIAGLVLPVIPGWLLFFIGLSLLGLGSTPAVHRLKARLGLAHVRGHEDIHRIPSFYRTTLFIAVCILQLGLLVASFLMHGILAGMLQWSNISGAALLDFATPTLAFLLGVVGLGISTFWRPDDMDEDDIWERYFALEVVTLPLFWSVLQFLIR